MDGQSLEAWLREGLSLEQIGRRVHKDPSTVSYWVKKHGLQAVNRDRHAARGALDRGTLADLVESGASVAEIAEAVSRGKGTVRHWLKRYGLQTAGIAGRRSRAHHAEARERGLRTVRSCCHRHGETDFILDNRGSYRCKRWRWEAVVRRRRKVKSSLVAEAGGRCARGYDRCLSALHFHHMDPSVKRFGLADRGMAHSIERMRAEVRKCVLLCSNCHAEVEAGVIALPA
jgi:IS30 family transposase